MYTVILCTRVKQSKGCNTPYSNRINLMKHLQCINSALFDDLNLMDSRFNRKVVINLITIDLIEYRFHRLHRVAGEGRRLRV